VGGVRLFSLLAAGMVLALPVTAAAENVPVHLSLASGSLSARIQRETVSSVRLRVVDARGTGAGWKLRVAPRSGRLVVTSVRVSCAAGSTCTLPRTAVSYPVALDSAQRATVLDAAPRTGMGAIEVELTVANAAGLSVSLTS
jgi:hypothetical protein